MVIFLKSTGLRSSNHRHPFRCLTAALLSFEILKLDTCCRSWVFPPKKFLIWSGDNEKTAVSLWIPRQIPLEVNGVWLVCFFWVHIPSQFWMSKGILNSTQKWERNQTKHSGKTDNLEPHQQPHLSPNLCRHIQTWFWLRPFHNLSEMGFLGFR